MNIINKNNIYKYAHIYILLALLTNHCTNGGAQTYLNIVPVFVYLTYKVWFCFNRYYCMWICMRVCVCVHVCVCVCVCSLSLLPPLLLLLLFFNGGSGYMVGSCFHPCVKLLACLLASQGRLTGWRVGSINNVKNPRYASNANIYREANQWEKSLPENKTIKSH